MLDMILFQLFPYMAVTVAVVESIRRYKKSKFSYSSLSSQFLEGEHLFYGSIPWHHGILLVLAGHLVAFLFPRHILWFNSVPARLYILETTALIGGLLTLIGLVNLIVRRLGNARIRVITSPMDLVVLAVLLIQVGLGVYIAMTLRWGSSWFAIMLAPYLQSLLFLKPNLTLIAPLPLAVKLHILGAFVFFAVLPFSRLVHMMVVPLQYIGRPPQLVIWNRDPRRSIGR